MFAVFCVPRECLLRFCTLPSLGKGTRPNGQVKHVAFRNYCAFNVLSDLEIVIEGLLEAKFRLGGKEKLHFAVHLSYPIYDDLLFSAHFTGE
jgi:hypothetical protein